jgi:predicted nucleic acid-binding protein
LIVLDTTILVYAIGADHPLREPCRRIVGGIRDRRLAATTTVEVIQALIHARARRSDRSEASRRGREYAQLLAPLIIVTSDDLMRGLQIFERQCFGSFDAVLAGAALNQDAEALISADTGFGAVRGLRYVNPATKDLLDLIS